MIVKNLKVFSQNVWKNRLLTDTILETNKNFDIFHSETPMVFHLYHSEFFKQRKR